MDANSIEDVAWYLTGSVAELPPISIHKYEGFLQNYLDADTHAAMQDVKTTWCRSAED